MAENDLSQLADSFPADDIEWRQVPGFPDYRVCSDGSVWSCRERGRWKRIVPWHLLKTPVDNHGYPQVNLRQNGKAAHFKVHQLVLLAFVGPKPPGMCVRHLNCVPTDNGIANLAYGTYRENSDDTARLGRTSRGAGRPLAKLSDAAVGDIRRRVMTGEKQTTLAREYGVSNTTICDILAGRVWAHVPQ